MVSLFQENCELKSSSGTEFFLVFVLVLVLSFLFTLTHKPDSKLEPFFLLFFIVVVNCLNTVKYLMAETDGDWVTLQQPLTLSVQ